jgi:hypothetical protein
MFRRMHVCQQCHDCKCSCVLVAAVVCKGWLW